jgi:hypothetical protein
MLRTTIIPFILASVLLATATGIPSIIHRCSMAYAEVCQPEVCCIDGDAEADPCCTEEATSDADDACCVETVVVHSAHTTAVPTASVELPRLSVTPAFLNTIVARHVALSVVLETHPHDVPCIPYSPPDQAHLGVFLI